VRLSLLIATLAGLAPACAQPAPEYCTPEVGTTLNNAYLSCMETAAEPVLNANMTPALVAEFAFAACASSRSALTDRSSDCGHPLNFEDSDHNFRNRMADIVATYRKSHPR
jgi:hypothetical protein